MKSEDVTHKPRLNANKNSSKCHVLIQLNSKCNFAINHAVLQWSFHLRIPLLHFGNPVISQRDDNSVPKQDSRRLSRLIVELNIARRNFSSYPNSHPLISASLHKVIDSYNRFIQLEGEVTIGIARYALMFKGELLDKNNMIFRGFAKFLFERGIGALTLRHGLTPDELGRFIEIICLKREDLLNRGGITTLWEKAAISSLATVRRS